MLASLASLLRIVVPLVALGSLTVAAIPVTRHLNGKADAAPARPAAVGAPVAEAEAAPPDLGPILDLAPFGQLEVASPPEAPIVETTLDLVLRGVVLQEDPDASMAFILHDGRTQGYRPGDTVADRARLVEVGADQAVLEVEGSIQTLSFPDPSSSPDPDSDYDPEADYDPNLDPGLDPGSQPEPDDAAAPAAEAPALSGPERLRQMVASQTDDGDAAEGSDASDDEAPGGEGEAAEASLQDEPQTVQDQIDLWLERIRANPREALDAMGLIPADNGYRIAEQHDGSVDLAGLQAGDVITSVNGRVVGDVEQDRQLFDEVVASGQARIEVQRDGRVLVLTFPLQ